MSGNVFQARASWTFEAHASPSGGARPAGGPNRILILVVHDNREQPVIVAVDVPLDRVLKHCCDDNIRCGEHVKRPGDCARAGSRL